ncbi:MAG: tetratricopeptide repeat protein, partial [Bryobacteraceae bacterium]|nr:tetratricopeptide repeat protein [Bryobacteraceae bacterium]
QHYQKAQHAQAARDYPTAIHHYERIVVLRPDLGEAFANLGALYYEVGDRDKANSVLKKALALKPDLAGPWFFLGALAVKSHNYGEALRYLEKAQRLDPDNLLVQLYLGYGYFGQSKHREAIPPLQRATALSESRTDALYHLSKAYAQLSGEAIERLRKTHPHSPFLSLARAHYHEVQGKFNEAKAEYDRLIQQHPQASGLKQRRAWLDREGSESTPPPALMEGATTDSTIYFYEPPPTSRILDEMEKHQAAAMGLDSDTTQSPDQLFQMAEVYRILSFLSSLWVVQSDADSYRSHQLQGELLEAQGKTEQAIAAYLKAAELQPRLEGVHFSIGNLYWVGEKADDAMSHLQKELALNANHPQAHYEIGDILYAQSKLPEAARHFSEALRLDPNMVDAHLAAGRILEQGGQFAVALEHLRKAIKIAPDNPTPHYRMSVIYRRLGKTAEAELARRTFQKLKAEQPAEN